MVDLEALSGNSTTLSSIVSSLLRAVVSISVILVMMVFSTATEARACHLVLYATLDSDPLPRMRRDMNADLLYTKLQLISMVTQDRE